MIKLSPSAYVAKGALLTYLKPRLAQDTAIDLAPILKNVRAKTFREQIPTVAAMIQTMYRGRLAADADLEDIGEILETIGGQLKGEESEVEDEGETEAGSTASPGMSTETPTSEFAPRGDAELSEFLKGKLSPEDCARAMDMMRHRAEDETETEEEEREREKGEDAEWDRARDRRADDARMKMGRDESEEEKEKREREEGEARDRKRAADRKVARDKRMARDRKRADDARMKMGRDETEAEIKEREEREKAEDRKRAADRMMKRAEDARRARDGGGMEHVSKAAIDAAIEQRVQTALQANDARHRNIVEAIEHVRPKVGRIAMDASIVNAGDVFKRALRVLAIDHEGINDEKALRRIFDLVPRPGSDSQNKGYALDAAPPASAFDDFKKQFGDSAASIEQF